MLKKILLRLTTAGLEVIAGPERSRIDQRRRALDQYFLLCYFHLHDLGLYVQDSQPSLQHNKTKQTTNNKQNRFYYVSQEKEKGKKRNNKVYVFGSPKQDGLFIILLVL